MTTDQLTVGQRKALAVLWHGHSQVRPVTPSFVTTPASRWTTDQLTVAGRTLAWLRDEELAYVVAAGGTGNIYLTSAGMDLAERLEL